jgi:hypothetical protein
VTPTSVTIAGKSATCTPTLGTGFSCTYTVQAGDANGNAAVVITVKDLAGNSANINVTPSPPVIIDTVTPSFTIVELSPAIARAGDVIALSFGIDEQVALNGVTIAGATASCNRAQGTTFSCTYPVTLADAAQASVPISITVKDSASNSQSTTSTTDGSATEIRRTVAVLSFSTSNGTGAPNLQVTPGDIMSLFIRTNEPLPALPTALFGTQSVNCTEVTSTSFTCNRLVLASDPLGAVGLSVTVRGITYTATTDGTTVTITPVRMVARGLSS